MADRPGSFFDNPAELLLSPLRSFSFASAASWSEVELYAQISGADVDARFLSAVFTAAYFFPMLYAAIRDELATGVLLDTPANSILFVECIFKTLTPVPSIKQFFVRPQFVVLQWLSENGVHVENSALSKNDEIRRKYELLAVLDRKFPYLLVKFYALHSADLRRDDMQFVSWLTHRLEARSGSDSRLDAVLRAMRDDASRSNRIAMYTT